MAYNEKSFTQGAALTTGLVTYYTAPSNILKAIVKEMLFCNTSASPVTFTVSYVPSGGSSSASTTQFAAVTLQANETKIFGRTLVMNPGDFIQALASTGAVVSMNISGVERT